MFRNFLLTLLASIVSSRVQAEYIFRSILYKSQMTTKQVLMLSKLIGEQELEIEENNEDSIIVKVSGTLEKQNEVIEQLKSMGVVKSSSGSIEGRLCDGACL